MRIVQTDSRVVASNEFFSVVPRSNQGHLVHPSLTHAVPHCAAHLASRRGQRTADAGDAAGAAAQDRRSRPQLATRIHLRLASSHLGEPRWYLLAAHRGHSNNPGSIVLGALASALWPVPGLRLYPVVVGDKDVVRIAHDADTGSRDSIDRIAQC